MTFFSRDFSDSLHALHANQKACFVVCAISSIHYICCSFQSSRGICGPQKPGVCGGPAGESSQPTASVDRLWPRPDGSVGRGSSVCHSALFGHTGTCVCVCVYIVCRNSYIFFTSQPD